MKIEIVLHSQLNVSYLLYSFVPPPVPPGVSTILPHSCRSLQKFHLFSYFVYVGPEEKRLLRLLYMS